MSVLDKGEDLVDGDRQQDYGDPKRVWTVIAKGWDVIFSFGVTARTAIIAMMWLKIARELIKPKQDNRDDLGGYLLILDRMEKENEQTFQRRVDTEGDLPRRDSVVDGEDTADRDTQPPRRGGMLRIKSILGRISGNQGE